MDCTSCGHANPEAARFCNECGRAQPTADGAEAFDRGSPASYTPPHLSREILRMRSSLEGERKLVTVLFADIARSLELARSLDAEEWHRSLDRFFHILAEGVHRYEGTINQYTGDGVMAIFGAPLAHEDHAQRACHAALHVQGTLHRFAREFRRRHARDFSVRMGINSGEVVVGKIGDDLRMDYTAQGDAVGLAARMQQVAEADTICVPERVAKTIEGYFQLRDRGPTTVAGFPEPLHVHVLETVGPLATRLDASDTRGFSRLVGRSAALATLQSALVRAGEGEAVVVGVEGEAGVGKSRLCREFALRAAESATVHEAHCPSHGQSLPRLLAAELVRDLFGVEPSDGEGTLREVVAADPVFRDEEIGATLPWVLDLLGLAAPSPAQPPAQAPARPFGALMAALFRDRSRERPLVVIVDDLHWIDSKSDELLAQLIDAATGNRALVVVNFRPEYRADWMQNANFYRLGLRPLDAVQSQELVQQLLGEGASAAALPASIRERAGGNPFFIEELVRSLVESDAFAETSGSSGSELLLESVELPPSLQALLAARMDRLNERDKRVLQTAAVIGLRFSPALLRSTDELPEPEVDEALASLQAADFIYRDSIYSIAPCGFRHPLMQEVAYRSLLSERRTRLHAAVALALEETSKRLGEQAGLLAHHWDMAGDPKEAALWRRRAAFRVTNLQTKRPRRQRGRPVNRAD